MSGNGLDARLLRSAILLGTTGNGQTWPNPSVGAILVKGGRVIAHARTADGGRPHAERIALDAAGERARGATLYVSLEPCSHTGRTPPCADAIADAGVARVVSACSDPDPRVAGRGHALLREAGVDVVADAALPEGVQAHQGHIVRVRENRPHVLLKLAVSADGGIGRRGEGQVAITGATARAHVHALRARSDAIMIGSGTALADAPKLTSRLPGLAHRSPVRVVLDRRGRLSGLDPSLDERPDTWLLSHSTLAENLSELAQRGITRLMVEGGATLARAFLEEQFVDEFVLLRAPGRLGTGRIDGLAGLSWSILEEPRFRLVERARLGSDSLERYLGARKE